MRMMTKYNSSEHAVYYCCISGSGLCVYENDDVCKAGLEVKRRTQEVSRTADLLAQKHCFVVNLV
jgi:hypothetical protein